jgi:hypothetical protein
MTKKTRKKRNKTGALPGNAPEPVVTQITGLTGSRKGAARGPDGSQVSTPGRTDAGPSKRSRRQITNT